MGCFGLRTLGRSRPVPAEQGRDGRSVRATERSCFWPEGTLGTDGLSSVVAAVRGREISVFHRLTARRWNMLEIPMPAGCGTGKGVAIGDMDLDGRHDIVFTCEGATAGRSGVRWLSAGSWKDHEISGPVGTKFDRIELLDLDADGDLDVLTCEETENLGVIWYENPTRHN